jgi:hypothetical protein
VGDDIAADHRQPVVGAVETDVGRAVEIRLGVLGQELVAGGSLDRCAVGAQVPEGAFGRAGGEGAGGKRGQDRRGQKAGSGVHR